MADKIDEAKEKAKIIAEEGAEKAKKAAKLAAEKLDEYYNKLPINQETKDKAKAIAGKAGENAKNILKIIIEKLDGYYNKLPLDKINEKLGGKVDVKSKKFKKIFASTVAIILFFIVFQFCFATSADNDSSNSVEKWTKKIEEANARLKELKEQIEKQTAKLKLKEPEVISKLKKDMENEPIPEKYGKIQYQNQRLLLHLAKTDKKLFKEYSHARSVAAGSSIYPEGYTPQEFINIIKQHKTLSIVFNRDYNADPHEESSLKENHKSVYEYEFNQRKEQRLAELYKNVTILKERHAKLSKQISDMTAKKYLAEQKITWPQTKKDIENRAVSVINDKLDESFDSCQKVIMEKKPFNYQYTASNRDEWWRGVATLNNSKTGKNKRRKVEVTYGKDLKTGKIMCVVTLKNERP